MGRNLFKKYNLKVIRHLFVNTSVAIQLINELWPIVFSRQVGKMYCVHTITQWTCRYLV